MKVDLYSSQHCGFCAAAKSLLNRLGITFSETDLTLNFDLRRKLMAQTNHRTVPMIFINDEFIGGYTELAAHLAKAEPPKAS